jgi:FkbM family methyltransferase
MSIIFKKIQFYASKLGIYISRKPLKYYYELENEIHNSLITASNGIIHIGAHFGQEAEYYHSVNKKVIWIEALPEVYEILKTQIKQYPNQKAYCALLGARKSNKVKFYLSNNNFSASSFYKLSPNSGFNNVEIKGEVELPCVRLDSLLHENVVKGFNHWVLDVQGAELEVLKGAGKLIYYIFSIQVEVSTRITYLNGTKYKDLKDFLGKVGFFPLWEPSENDHTNIIFINKKYSMPVVRP